MTNNSQWPKNQMTNRLSSLEIDIWDLIEIWCVGFEISEILNTRDIISKDSPSIA